MCSLMEDGSYRTLCFTITTANDLKVHNTFSPQNDDNHNHHYCCNTNYSLASNEALYIMKQVEFKRLNWRSSNSQQKPLSSDIGLVYFIRDIAYNLFFVYYSSFVSEYFCTDQLNRMWICRKGSTTHILSCSYPGKT